MNREHALFGASRCVAVSPSDTATALGALEATMIVTSRRGSREVPVDDFFVGPDVDIVNMTALADDEVLASVRLPNRWANAEFHFEKVADRNVWGLCAGQHRRRPARCGMAALKAPASSAAASPACPTGCPRSNKP